MKTSDGRETGAQNRCPVCGDAVFLGDRFGQTREDTGRYVIGHYMPGTQRLCAGSGKLPSSGAVQSGQLNNLLA